MPHELPKTYEPAAIEEKWAARWVEQDLWRADMPTENADRFTMLLPPPNVTGRLHMGHMLNQTEMDILTRWHRMRGDNTLWVPGTDHAGIATQMMVERKLISEGTSRQSIGREAFIERVWNWRAEYGDAILAQMRRLGASVDWSREYFTMDESLSRAVREAFVRLHEQGLIYRGRYIVNWDPVQQTAVSDLEVTHEERVGKLYHVRYPLADGTGSIIIATTRPETMLGDTAVAVHPDDARYSALVGKALLLPLSGVAGSQERTIPVIADAWANPEFGTGAVKVTPAHDPNDFAIGERHNLPQLTIMDGEARIDLPGSPYHGLDRYAARERIVEDLRTAGLLVDVKDHAMSIGLSQRTGAVIEPRLSTQWFLKIQPLAERAIEAVDKGHIRFTPDQYRKTYMEWMRNIHDWCISRQLWWGHRIPAWHCMSCTQITVAREAPDACIHCNQTELVQDTDVLDTWFSSGLLPFTVFGWPERTPDLAAFYPTTLLVTGFDILFFWVARMVMFGCHFMLGEPNAEGKPRTLAESVPFREVYIHALVRDADRQKMSKTKGNVIDPIEIVNRYGTDAVRFTLASMASPGTDIAFNEQRTEGYRAFANKIWNAARFIFMNVERAREAGVAVDMNTLFDQAGSDNVEARWIRSRFPAEAVNNHLDQTNDNKEIQSEHAVKYRFDLAASRIYEFFWNDFCDWYLEAVKMRLEFRASSDNSNAVSCLVTLLQVFEATLRLLSPFMPFVTEELWHALYRGQTPVPSISVSSYPRKDSPFVSDNSLIWEFKDIQILISKIRLMRKERGVLDKDSVLVRVHVNASREKLFLESSEIIERLARASKIIFVQTPIEGSGVMRESAFDAEVVFSREIDPKMELARLTKDVAQLKKSLDAADRQLNSDGFLSKAPAQVVEGLRAQHAENTTLLAKKQAELDTLGGKP